MSKRRGREALFKDPAALTVYMDRKDYLKIKEAAAKRGQSITEFIRRAIWRALDILSTESEEEF